FTGPYFPYIQQALGNIGIHVKYTQETADTWLKKYTDPKTPVIFFPSYFNATAPVLAVDGLFHPGKVDIAQPYLDVINRAATEDEANKAWAELGDLMLDKAWIIPVSQSSTVIASKGTVIKRGYLELDLREIRPAT